MPWSLVDTSTTSAHLRAVVLRKYVQKLNTDGRVNSVLNLKYSSRRVGYCGPKYVAGWVPDIPCYLRTY